MHRRCHKIALLPEMAGLENMFFTASNLVHYLLSRDLLAIADVVDGDFAVVEAGRRNRNFKVMLHAGGGLFVKQVKTTDALNIASIQRETCFFRFAQNDSDWAAFLPRMIDHDPIRHSLIVELIPGSETILEYHFRQGKVPPVLGRLLGRALALCHDPARYQHLRAAQLSLFAQATPWILSFRSASGRVGGGILAMLAFFEAHPALRLNMERLRQAWRVDALIHNDMKWDNCIVFPGPDGAPRLKIIDWEMVDVGDVAWDIGAVFAAHFASAVFFSAAGQKDPAHSLPQQAIANARAMHPALQAFWQSYLASIPLSASNADALLLRAVDYAGARLVMTAFELVVDAAAMSEHAQTLLHLSLQIMLDPAAAAHEVFGVAREGATG